ncbi:MAG: VOC family protein [Dysgonomonas sp.]|nr:VOC family protein [Dysgonomonas sp.]
MLLKSQITFDGQAEEALNFYKEVFNGKIENLMRFEDIPNRKFEDGIKKHIINARLNFGQNVLNVCDAMPHEKVNYDGNITLDVVSSDEDEVTNIYKSLTKDGEIIMPLQATYFSKNFGIFKDKFGIKWNIMQM